MTAPVAPEVAAALADLQRQADRFAVTRQPCPSWCDGSCADEGDFGTAVIHQQQPQRVEIAPGQGDDWHVLVKAWRHESTESGVEDTVDLDIRRNDDGSLVGFVTFTTAQARQLAAAVTCSADLLDPANHGGAR